MNLDYAWLIGLRDYLIRENTEHPPEVLVPTLVPDPENPDGPPILQDVSTKRPFGIIQTGRYQDDPQQNFGVLSLHLGDVDDPSWWHERDGSQLADGGGTARRPFGAQMEIGGGTFWWFRYSAEMKLFYTLENYDQVLALAHATEAIHWCLKRLNLVGPRTIGVNKVDGFKPIQQTAEAVKPEERGGQDNWIWYARIHLQLYVHADRLA